MQRHESLAQTIGIVLMLFVSLLVATGLIGCLVLVLLLFNAWSPGGFVGPALTPEEAVRRPSQSFAGQSFQILGRRARPDGILFIYRRNLPGGEPALGCHLVVQRGMGWEIDSSWSFNGDQLAIPTLLVHYSAGERSRTGETWLCGQILSPAVIAVEAVTDSNQTVRVAAQEGVFVLDLPKDAVPELLRVIGADDQVLQEIDIRQPQIRILPDLER
jgi:hypothetical protein